MKTRFTLTGPNRRTPSIPRPPQGVVRAVWALVLGLALMSTAVQAQALVTDSADAKVSGLLQQQADGGLPELGTDAEPVAAFYAQAGYAPVWTRPTGPAPAALVGWQLLAAAADQGLEPTDYNVDLLRSLLDSLGGPAAPNAPLRARAEQQFTAALLRFVRHLRDGRLTDASLRPATGGKTAFDAGAYVWQALRDGCLAEGLLAAQPTSRSYVRLLWAWHNLQKHDSTAAVRLRLPIALNLERLRWEPRADSLYFVVNIPAYELQVVRGARVAARHRVVVGQPTMPTPELYSQITYFQAAPEWRMPLSMAAREMLPRLRRDPGCLADRGYELFTAGGRPANPYRVKWDQVTPEAFPYQIRQAPSSDNALGDVVFRFANPFAVYMHDTPAKKAFRASTRALSHGCIRVEHPLDLACFLLLRDGKTGPDRVEELAHSVDRGRTKAFTLHAPVPLVVRYLTCEADGDQLRQLPDIYGRDRALRLAWQNASAAHPGSLLVLR